MLAAWLNGIIFEKIFEYWTYFFLRIFIPISPRLGFSREGFIRESEHVTDFFGSFATQALQESGYLINRMADRFAD